MQNKPRIDKERLRKITQTIINLPTLPTVVAKMIEIIDDPKSSARSLGRLVKTDQVLTTRILRLANSAFYGFPNPISTINLAVVVLGFETIKNLGLSVSIIDRFARAEKDDELLDYTRFWEHSVGVGVASQMIARMHGFRAIEGESFVAGLIHDIGKVILSQYQTHYYSECLRMVEEENILLLEAEERIFEVNHAEVGWWLAKRWNLPDALSESIRLHHVPLTAKVRPELSAIVHFADILTRAARIGNGGDPLVPPFYRGVLRRLPLRLTEENRVDMQFYLEAVRAEMEIADTFINIILGKRAPVYGGDDPDDRPQDSQMTA
ncbi:MAG: HDOD domain-containing protein [Candidatus Glassbacteria bacterium]|nr:HDOD domain-containing protein [Candidatus Glassbacteria bacterium]